MEYWMNELYHSGVKKQKWGIRRYQNYDGSLTPLGRIHYGVGKAKKEINNFVNDPGLVTTAMRISSMRNQKFNGTLTPAGKERYGKDISLVNEHKLNRQMQRNQFVNSAKINDHFKSEDKLNAQFVKELRAKEREHKPGTPNMAKEGERFIRELASIRLKSMGYEANSKNIEILAGKKWFRNSSWITNTLASVGVKDVDHTSRDDILYRGKQKNSVLDGYKK